MCVAARNQEKFTVTPIFGGFRSFKDNQGHQCWHS